MLLHDLHVPQPPRAVGVGRDEMKLQLDTVKSQLEEKTKETFPQPPQLPDPVPDPVPVPEPGPQSVPEPVPVPVPEPVPEPKREPKNFVKFNPNLPLYAISASKKVS